MPHPAIIRRFARRRRSLLGVSSMVVGLLVPLTPARGQASLGEMRRQATRAELEAMAAASETAANAAPDAKTRERHRANALAVRQRLTNGDFNPGDRILVQILGDTAMADTFTVRIDRKVQVPSLPEVSLHGVLDSELPGHFQSILSKYFRNVQVTTSVLLRVAVVGAVGRPGFYTAPVDQAIADFLTSAGLTQVSDVPKIVVRRSGADVIDRNALQLALAQGKTLGDLSIRDGDQIYVPQLQPSTNRWQTFLGGGGLLGLVFIILRNRGRN